MVGAVRSNYLDGLSPVVPTDGGGVRELQRKLWVAAKRSPDRRFHALFDRICRSDVLWEAWRRVRKNKGAAGIDRQTLEAVEEFGVDRLLGEVQAELSEGRYRPLPVRRVQIPKPQGGVRPLGIPTVKDRVVQQAARIVLEPIFGKRRTTGMREGNERVLHRRLSESRWPRVMRWRPARAQRSVHRGARRPVIEPRNGSDHWGADAVEDVGRQHRGRRFREPSADPAGSENPACV